MRLDRGERCFAGNRRVRRRPQSGAPRDCERRGKLAFPFERGGRRQARAENRRGVCSCRRQGMSSMSVPFMRLEHAEGLPAPSYASEGAAGLDLMAALPEMERLVIDAESWDAISSGLE